MMVTMPRFILAEFNTHRMFSRNSASSRAIPFKKMVQSVQENPFIPITWQKDHKGMQGTEYVDTLGQQFSKEIWLSARTQAISAAEAISAQGVTKQLCNRLLEPFMYHTVLVTATEWENFFKLRCPQYHYEPENKYFRSKRDYIAYYESCFPNSFPVLSDLQWLEINKGQAEIHMMAVAEAMWDAMNESTPKQLQAGEWHIPFGDKIDKNKLAALYFNNNSMPSSKGYKAGTEVTHDDLRIQISTARCARVSYTVIGEEGKDNYEADIKLHDMLSASGHWSPFEHCAKVMSQYLTGEGAPPHSQWSRNFRGWIQYRALVDIKQ